MGGEDGNRRHGTVLYIVGSGYESVLFPMS